MNRRSGARKSTTKRRTAARPQNRSGGHRSSSDGVAALLVGTQKGAFIYHTDPSRSRWTTDGPHFLGHIINHIVLDPRDGTTLLAASKTGHLGPTIFRSTDRGRTWKEAAKPPAFGKFPEGWPAYAVDFSFHLSPGHPSEPNVWWAGTCPPGLFRSDDGGITWHEVEGFNRHPMYPEWGTLNAQSPWGSMLQWITIDPRDPRHIYLVTSEGGIFETTDNCASWRPLNKNVECTFLPDPYPEFGQDTHCLQMHPLDPDRLYQQNHCGIYRLDRPSDEWVRIGRNMPAEIGDIGFGIVLHPRDPDTAWVYPMDGTTVWPRTPIDGKPAVYRTRDGGAKWERQDRGLPRNNAWYTVLRQAFVHDGRDPLGIYFGTTCGEVWMSRNEGQSWNQIANRLQRVLSVSAETFA